MASLPTELSMLTTNSFQKSQARLLAMPPKCLIATFATSKCKHSHYTSTTTAKN